jgi:anti-anti-sigma factor
VRRTGARQLLDKLGNRIAVYELQGDLFFANVERVIRHVLDDADTSHVVFDLRRVATIDSVAVALIHELCATLATSRRQVRLVGTSPELRRSLAFEPDAAAGDVEDALELCEEELLHEAAGNWRDAGPPIALGDFLVLRDLSPEEIVVLENYLERRTFAAGETFIEDGAPADALYFIEDGAVEIRVPQPDGRGAVRLETVEAGNIVGELALLGGPRTAEVAAAPRASTLVLRTEGFAALGRAHPRIESKLLAAIGRSLAARLRQADAEIGALRR